MTPVTDTPAIQLEGVSKRFGRRDAVIDLSLTVPRGGVYGLLGHNGAGKSTTLGMVLGQVFPDRGRVTVHGHDVFRGRGRAAALARVGAIYESPSFYDYLTGRRNLKVFAEFTGPITRPRVDEVVALVGLTDRIDDKAGTYSHGMRQRLALAQALLPGPELLILDEPSDGLDPEGVREMRQLIRRLRDEHGLTILFSSHMLQEVEQVCDRVAVMRHGRLMFDGPLSQAIGDSRYLHLDCDRRGEAVAALRAAGLVNGHAPPPPTEDKVALAGSADPAAVNRFLHDRGFAVSAIGPTKLTLEEFYLRLAEGGGAAGSEAAG